MNQLHVFFKSYSREELRRNTFIWYHTIEITCLKNVLVTTAVKQI